MNEEPNPFKCVEKDLKEVERLMLSAIPKEPAAVYGAIPEYLQRGGKRFRPALLLASCRAVGGDVKKAYGPSALLELFHNFTLMHDDIEDGSMFRRGKPTLNSAFGIPVAINSGDALYTLVWNSTGMINLPCEKKLEVMGLLASGFRNVVDGQGIELEWNRGDRFDISEDEYMRMIGGKTASLIALSCRLGAYIGGADRNIQDALYEFGFNLGLGFQIADDVLNIIGDFEKYKKEIGGDIREGKRTLMVIRFLKGCTPAERKELLSYVGNARITEQETSRAIQLLKSTDSVEYAKRKAHALVDEAIGSLSALKPSAYKDALERFARFSVSRDV